MSPRSGTLDDLDGIAQDNERSPQDLLNQYQREFATAANAR